MGHGVGILLIAVTIAVLDPARRVALPRLLTAALGSGLAANLLKLSLSRTRPAHFHWNGNGFDTFCDWFPLLGNSSWTQSFPSSHTAVAAGLAVVLSWMYPRGRWLFPAFAALAGGQRILEEAHYLSDVLWGAAVGCVFAPLCVYGSTLAQFFDRLETRLAAASASRPGDTALEPLGAAEATTHEHPRAA